MSDAKHRSLRNGGLGDGLRRGEKIAIVGGGWRFGEPPPDAQAVPPEAHESLGSQKTVAEVPLTGLSFTGRLLNFFSWKFRAWKLEFDGKSKMVTSRLATWHRQAWHAAHVPH